MSLIDKSKNITIVAPGRTCLFGDHQDYLGLPVIACAIDRHIVLNAKMNKLKKFVIRLSDLEIERHIEINASFEILEPRDYFGSALRVLRRYGCIPNSGYDIDISGNIPINSGNSSSSAVLLAWIYFLVEAFGITHQYDKSFLAELGYEAEILEHNEPGGMMDHFSISFGGVIKVKTNRPFNCIPIKSSLNGMVSGVSGVPKETVGLLARVKGNALKAIEIIRDNFVNFEISQTHIEDLPNYIKYLPKELIPYFEGAVENHSITQRALKEFENPTPNVKTLGNLMNQHHQILRDKLKITVPKIDTMIDTALNNGAYGAKIVGSGGGGSIVVVTELGTEGKIVESLLSVGAKEAYPIKVDEGLRLSPQYLKKLKI